MLCKLLEDAGHKVRYRSSKEDDWKRSLKKPADLIVVAGGDGTVGKVARRMVGRGIPMSILPSGTANNIARTLGVLDLHFEKIVRAWDKPRRVKLDVGVAAGPWGERYFVEGIGAGIFAGLLAVPASKKLKDTEDPVEHGLERLKQEVKRAEPV